jgi:hypothetical protein
VPYGVQWNGQGWIPLCPVPASPAAAGTGVPGAIAYDGTWLYVCTAANTWRKIRLTTDGSLTGSTYLANNGSTFGIISVEGLAVTRDVLDIGDAGRGAGLRSYEDGGGFIQLSLFTRVGAAVTERLTVRDSGRVGINKTSPNSNLAVTGLPAFADNGSALAGGLTAGDFYQNSGALRVVV